MPEKPAMEIISALLKWIVLFGLLAAALWACVSMSRRLFRLQSRKPRKAKGDRRKRRKRVRDDRRDEPRRQEDVARDFMDDIENR
jgi:hypothetical protein